MLSESRLFCFTAADRRNSKVFGDDKAQATFNAVSLVLIFLHLLLLCAELIGKEKKNDMYLHIQHVNNYSQFNSNLNFVVERKTQHRFAQKKLRR